MSEGTCGFDSRPVYRWIVNDKGATKMDTLILEVRAAEGGDDSKLLVLEQLRVYARVAALHRL